MRLNQNIDSLNIFRNYNKNLKTQAKTMERIGSGSKINSSKDNPNKLGVRENLRIQLRGIQMAERNLQDGVSMLQAADGTLGNVNEMLIRMKELAVKAGGTNSESDLNVIQNEINQLKEGINQMANNSEFNGVKLLAGDETKTLTHMVGANSGENIEIPIYNITSESLFGDSLDVTINIDKSIESVDKAITNITSIRSKYGAIQNRMESTYDNLGGNSFNLQNAESRIGDADLALEMADFARTSILTESSLALLNQTNKFPQDILRVLENMK